MSQQPVTGIFVPAICEPDLQNQPIASRLAVIIDVLLGLEGGSPTLPPTSFPATLAAGGTYNSGAIPMNGMAAAAVSVNSTQNGVLTIQRYIDAAATIPIGAAITQAMAGGTLATAAFHDGLPCAAFIVTFTNTGGVTANITQTAILRTR